MTEFIHSDVHIMVSFHIVAKKPLSWAARQVTQVKRRKGWRMSCDLGEATEVLENEALLILQPFRLFTSVTVTSSTSPSEPPMALTSTLSSN